MEFPLYGERKNRDLGYEDNKWKTMVYTDGACARITVLLLR
jgi:hypothetical protein